MLRAVRFVLVVLAPVALIVAAAIVAHPPPLHNGEQLPEVALGSTSVYWAERAFALIIVGLLALATIYNAVIERRLPTEFGREGVKWATAETAKGVEDLKTVVDELVARVTAIEAVRVSQAPASDADRAQVEALVNEARGK